MSKLNLKILSSDKMSTMGGAAQISCKFHKTGHCKFGQNCRHFHSNTICSAANCDMKCPDRHPKPCFLYARFGSCKFGSNCSYLHCDSAPVKDARELKRALKQAMEFLQAKEDQIQQKIQKHTRTYTKEELSKEEVEQKLAEGIVVVKFQKLNMLYGSLIVRAVLVRKEDTYRHFGVDVICENHKNDVGVESTDHVLHPASGMEASSYFDSDSGERHSLCFLVGMAKPDGSLEATIGLKSMCNDSCSTCADPTFKQTESSRDLLLVLTLESQDRNVILARRSVIIWPKAIVRPKDLNKPERRRPKGGAAKLLKKKEWIDKMKTVNVLSSPSTSRSQSHYPTLAPPPLSGGGGESEKKYNLIMRIQTTNNVPTKHDIFSSSINFVIKNAKTSKYSKEDFMRLMSETWDICD